MEHQRLMVTINPKQVTTLDTFSACCKQSGGRKLSRACIIRAMARVAGELDIDVDSGQILNWKKPTTADLKSFKKEA